MAGKEYQVRFYEAEMPEIGELVMVKVEKMTDTSCYVRLLEYNHIEGMIPYTELSRRRIRSINQLAKVGRLQVAVVIRLDKEKGYIDLSKKQVTPDERRKCEERYQKGKTVAGIMRHTAQETGKPAIEVMKSVAWPLYRNQTYKSAYEALKLAVSQPEAVLGPLNLSDDIYQRVVQTVQHKLKAEILKIQADVNVTCFTIEGVDAIRDVLQLGRAHGQQDSLLVNIEVLAPPTYVVYTHTDDKEEGLRKLWECVEVMKEEMKVRGGQVDVPLPPRVIGHEDETVAGDSGSESEIEE